MTPDKLYSQENVNGQQTDEEINNRLERLGVPDEIIDMMPLEQKLEVIKQNEKVTSASIASFDNSGTLIKTTTFEQNGEKVVTNYNILNNGLISPMTISSSSMDLGIVAYMHSSYNGHQQRDVELSYVWKHLPKNRGEDPMIISWSSHWRPVSGTLHHKDQYLQNSTYHTYYSDTAASDLSDTGVSWDARLTPNVYASELTGYGEITIRRTDTKGYGKFSENIYGKYIHTWGQGTIGVSIGVLSASFTGTKSHDDRATMGTIK